MQNALKIYPFPQTPILENEENEKNSVSESVTESLTTRVRARAREMAEIADYYCATFGAPAMPPVAGRQITGALDQGMDYALIFTAIDEAALAPRPSWAYAAAILRRLIAEGVRTPEDYEKRQAAWRKKRGLDELPF